MKPIAFAAGAFAAGLMLASAGSARAAETAHPCSADAVTHARALMAFHFGEGLPDFQVDDTAKLTGTVKALRGEGRFDVLEVWAYVIKTEYRMHFLYAQIPGDCVLMGQEILEASDPY
ncbi:MULTISPECIES: hypothetical protein [Inquilinus]|uniref:Uncharacterized protein n=1 Tax=Inquilinus ginsengisoli TaxID=363840 RepID=A0ABU1JZR9_9PROT|nr:hypothetical protein [Inquilinus ginsengisoli]MDR6294116.1 hypothetical protein [Inquilinus ginsengisoli]